MSGLEVGGTILTWLDIALAIFALGGAILELRKRYVRRYLDMLREVHETVGHLKEYNEELEDRQEVMMTAIIDIAYAQEKEDYEVDSTLIHSDLSDEDFNKYTKDGDD